MHKIILALLIFCSSHFNSFADNKEDEKAKLLDWGILFDINYGFDVLTDGGGLGLSYFNDHHLLSIRFTGARFHKGSKDWYPSYDTYEEGGLLYGHLFTDGIVSGSVSGGIGVIWSDELEGYIFDNKLALGIPFELNGLIQLFRYFAVGIKVYGHISSYSFAAAQFCLRIGAVTQ